MTKTFNDSRPNVPNVFEVKPGDETVIFRARSYSQDILIFLTPSDAPALALAILEEAGHGGSSDSSLLMQAFDLIELHVKEQERITAEANEQAELKAEALELCDSARLANGRLKIGNFGLMKDAEKTTWLAVARRAREINKEENNA